MLIVSWLWLIDLTLFLREFDTEQNPLSEGLPDYKEWTYSIRTGRRVQQENTGESEFSQAKQKELGLWQNAC